MRYRSHRHSVMPSSGTYQILCSDGRVDRIAGRTFTNYDEAYKVLEEYYKDFCCSDESLIYRIELVN